MFNKSMKNRSFQALIAGLLALGLSHGAMAHSDRNTISYRVDVPIKHSHKHHKPKHHYKSRHYYEAPRVVRYKVISRNAPVRYAPIQHYPSHHAAPGYKTWQQPKIIQRNFDDQGRGHDKH